MESLSTVQALLRSNDYVVKVDLKSAYSQLPIQESSRNLLSFRYQSKLYRYKVLPFGLSCAPVVWTRLMKLPMAALRARGVKCAFYLDDIIIAAQTPEQAIRHAFWCVELLSSLGLRLNFEKSVLVPAKRTVFLGYVLDTHIMGIALPADKRDNLRRAVRKWLNIAHNRRVCRVRRLASFIGSLDATRPAVPIAGIYTRELRTAKDAAVSRAGWDGSTVLPPSVLPELEWWKHALAALKPHSFVPFEPSAYLETDASDRGWGGVLHIGTRRFTAAGNFSEEEVKLHINAKELRAVSYTLLALRPHVFRRDIRLRTDNTTTVAMVQRWRATQTLNAELRFFAKVTQALRVRVRAEHVPGVLNATADYLSRRWDRSDYQLHPRLFRLVQRRWGPFSIDAFATRINAQLPRYWSYHHDVGAVAVDALAQRWSDERVYGNPPFRLILRICRLLVRQAASATLIVPYWPSQAWWPVLRQLLADTPRVLPRWENVFRPSSTLNRRGIGPPPWDILAVRLSGNPSVLRSARRHLGQALYKPQPL